MAMSENSKIVFDWVKAHDGEQFTAQDIADATGLGVKSVNGIVTMSFQRHKDADGNEVPLMERTAETEVQLADGTHKKVKFIQLTDEGRAFTPAE